MNQTRIVWLCTPFGWPVGGTGRRFSNWITHLDWQRFEVTLILGGSNSAQLRQAQEYYESKGPIQVVCIPQLAPVHRWLPKGLILLREQIELFRPHIIHSIFIQSDIIGSWAQRMCRTPVHISSIEGALIPDYASCSKRLLYKVAYSLSARHSMDGAIALCKSLADDVVASYGVQAEKLNVIPSGVDVSDFPPKRSWPYSPPLQPLTIGMIARLLPEKLPHLFVCAASHILEHHPETRFVIAGDGPELRSLQVLACRLGIAASFDFLGWVDEPGVLLQSLDILVFLSTNEGLPWTILEAQSVGVPVVASAVGGVPEIITHGITGLLQYSEDVHSLSEQIAWLMEHQSEAERIGLAARANIQSYFSIKKEIDMLMTLYENYSNAKYFNI